MEERLRAIASNFLETTKKSFVIIKKLTNNVFKLRDVFKPNRAYILKLILDKEHPLYSLGVSNGSRRSLSFHLLLQKYCISPKVIEYGKIDGGHAIIMEFIPQGLTLQSLEDPMILESIDSQIEKLHGLGIIHGDLHSNNIKYRSEIDPSAIKESLAVKVYFIDLDTCFFMKEYHDYQFPKKWIESAFDDISTLEEFTGYENINYKNLIDDEF